MKLSYALIILISSLFLAACAKQDQSIPEVPRLSSGGEQAPAASAKILGGNVDLTFDYALKLAVSAEEFDTAHKLDIAAKMLNKGSKDSGEFTATIYANDVTIYESQFSIPAGGSKTIQYLWKPSEPGTYKLKIVLDPADRISENNETNNFIELPGIPITKG